MAWTTELDELVQQTVVVKQLSSFNSYGEPSYSTAAGTTYNCRVTWSPHRVSDYAGNETIAQGHMIIATTATINITDEITLSNGESPAILAIRQVPWVDGTIHHYFVSIGGRRGFQAGEWG